MAYPKGAPRPPGSGRAKGTPNKQTKAMREMFIEAFDRLGGVDFLVKAAQDDPATFIRGLHRMIPSEVKAEIAQEIKMRVIDLSDARGKESSE